MQAETNSSLGQEIPAHPLTKLATDICYFKSSSYLLIVDCTSGFPVVCKLSSMTGLQIANQCKQVFSEYGWPQTLIADDGRVQSAFVSNNNIKQPFSIYNIFHHYLYINISLTEISNHLLVRRHQAKCEISVLFKTPRHASLANVLLNFHKAFFSAYISI